MDVSVNVGNYICICMHIVVLYDYLLYFNEFLAHN